MNNIPNSVPMRYPNRRRRRPVYIGGVLGGNGYYSNTGGNGYYLNIGANGYNPNIQANGFYSNIGNNAPYPNIGGQRSLSEYKKLWLLSSNSKQ